MLPVTSVRPKPVMKERLAGLRPMLPEMAEDGMLETREPARITKPESERRFTVAWVMVWTGISIPTGPVGSSLQAVSSSDRGKRAATRRGENAICFFIRSQYARNPGPRMGPLPHKAVITKKPGGCRAFWRFHEFQDADGSSARASLLDL